MTHCTFEPITERDDNGMRRWKCSRCGITTNPTANNADRIFCVCKVWGPDEPRVGDELTALLADLGIHDSAGCDCKKKATALNALGIDGCKERRAEIVAWLQEASGARGWWEKIAAGWRLLGEQWFSVADPYGSIVDEAIRRASVSPQANPDPLETV